MTPRQELKEMRISFREIANFFDLNESSFQNSSARKRYELAILRCIKHIQAGEQNKNDADAESEIKSESED